MVLLGKGYVDSINETTCLFYRIRCDIDTSSVNTFVVTFHFFRYRPSLTLGGRAAQVGFSLVILTDLGESYPPVGRFCASRSFLRDGACHHLPGADKVHYVHDL